MKIVVLGCKGQLGKCLYDHLENKNYEVIFTSREHIDITDFEATKLAIIQIAPDIVINAAAFTAVDKAEQEEEKANLINHLAVKNIASICKQINSWFIHISTDYVFDGFNNIAYREDGLTNPQSIYGESKLKGEQEIQSLCGKYIIIRTAWVFSEYGNNFLKTMFRLGSERAELSIISDQIGCPTYAQDIANAIVTILPNLIMKEELSGIYHYCGDTKCSWFEFAEQIFNELGNMDTYTIPTLEPVLTENYPSIAKRPMFSVLDNSHFNKKFGIFPSNLKQGITSSLQRLIGSNLV